MKKSGRILIGADIVPTEKNLSAFINADTQALVGEELESILKNADYRIFNLETAIYDGNTPIKKAGPNVSAPTACLNGYKALGADLLSIANNHVYDHGEEGFLSTISALESYGIDSVGGGKTVSEAKKPYVFTLAGKRIGVYACCEHEYSWALDFGSGSNGFDPLESLDEIKALKEEVDHVIVLYHGGKEHYRYPSPYLRKVCRKMVEKGADLVLCQHTHCVGATESYQGGNIVYGQGNFLFQLLNNEHWRTGMLVAVDVNEDGLSYEYIPVERTETGVRLSKDASILEGLKTRSEEILQDGFIEKKYGEFAKSLKDLYLGILARAETMEKTATIRNFIECEAHREVIIRMLKDLL